MSEKLILFQGDSITDAGRTSSSDPFYAMGCGYPLLTAARLLYEESHSQYHFLNKGISGNRIVDLYARWKEDTLNQKPDVISILIGVNDVWHEYQDHSGVDASKFEKMYDLLLEETKAALPQVRLVLCEPFILPVGEVLNRTERWMTDMAPRRVIVKKLADKFDAAFVPLQEAFIHESEKLGAGNLLQDGVHPTPAGHELISRQWIRYADIL